jgi:hypothetical protein
MHANLPLDLPVLHGGDLFFARYIGHAVIDVVEDFLVIEPGLRSYLAIIGVTDILVGEGIAFANFNVPSSTKSVVAKIYPHQDSGGCKEHERADLGIVFDVTSKTGNNTANEHFVFVCGWMQ